MHSQGYSVNQIDSIIQLKKLEYKNNHNFKPTKWALDGDGEQEFKTFKKILGLKIRIARGTVITEQAFLNKGPLYYCEQKNIIKKKFKNTEFDTIYFIDSKAVKFVKFSIRKNIEEDQHILEHKKMIYLSNNIVINAVADNTIFDLSKRKLKYLIKYINYTQKQMMNAASKN